MAGLGQASEIGTPVHVAATVGRLLHPRGSARTEGQRDTFREACPSEDVRAALGVQVGGWVLISQAAPGVDAAESSWLVRVVEAGDGAVVCPLATAKKGAIYLPANLIESLGATPGRSTVRVSRRSSAEGPPLAGRLSLARVRTPAARRRYRAALRSFFLVPRVLREGEVFSVPVGGVPRQLREVEDLGAAPDELEPSVCEESDGDGQPGGEESADLWCPGVPRCGGGRSDCLDPLSGLVFSEAFSFRVEKISPAARKVGGPSVVERCYTVDSAKTEVVVEGTAQARGLPYIAGHHFCAAPAPLPAPLLEPFRRLLAALAPAVRAWARREGAGGPPAAPSAALVAGPRGCGKRTLWRTVCDRLGLHLLEVNCHHLVAQAPGAVEEALQQLVLSAAAGSPAVLCLRRLPALLQGAASQSPAASLLRQRRLGAALAAPSLADLMARSAGGAAEKPPLVFLAATCEDIDDVAGALRKVFQVEVTLKRPDEAARAAALSQLLPVYRRAGGAATKDGADAATAAALAKLTVGLSFTDLRSVCSEVAMCPEETGADEVERGEKAVKRLQSGSKVAVTLSAKVQWGDVGGLESAKEEIINCISLPLSMGQAFEGQKLRSGVLLFGPPGTGKTLLAKAVATECKVHFLSVKGPELLSMYIGESEKNVRTLFQSARELKPCVVFFDELDSLAPARGRGSDSGGVMDRIVSQLVTELDAVPSTVFLIGATNRPDLLDRSLLRPGRLDRTVYLGISRDKLPLLRAVTRRFHLDEPRGSAPGRLLEVVAKSCPPNLTGADVSSLCTDAYAHAQKDHIGMLHDVAAGVGVSISTLLLFLEALDASPGAAAARGGRAPDEDAASSRRCPLVPLFPAPEPGELGGGCVLEAHRAGLALLQGRQRPGTFVLSRRSGTPGDVGSSLILEPAAAPAAPAAGEGSLFPAPREPPLALGGECGRCRERLARCGTLAVSPLEALRVPVGLRHFREALGKLQPSVPLEDLRRYEQLREEYQNVAG